MRKGVFAICSVLLVLVVSIAALAPGCTPTTGTIEVEATLDGSPWSGAVDYTLTGPGAAAPTVINGSSVPDSHSGDAGNWTCAYDGTGGPAGAHFIDITDSETQELSEGGTITFTLNFETEQVDASITWVSWTIDGQQVPPGSYTVYPPTIIDCEYDIFVAGTYCETVNVTASFELPYHYGGPNEFKSWHVANAPGSISTIPPGTIWSQNATVDGVVRPICYSFDVFNCQNVTLDAHITIELHKGTNYRVKINWLGYKGSGPDDILFDNIIEWAGVWGISDMVTRGCVHVDGDVNHTNDCSGYSEPLYITHNYTGT